MIGTTYDPATPYRGAKNLVRDLGNARLLTMRGDGHTAYNAANSTCIDPARRDYVNDRQLPAAGHDSARQEVGFEAPASAQVQAQARGRARRRS